MNENMESRYDLLTKWLRVLIYIGIVSLVNSIINFLPFVPAAVTTWISRGIMAAMIICTFQMAPLNERYKKAAVFRALMLCCMLVNAFLFSSTLILLASSIFSIVSVYQEYSGHSELVAQKAPKLSRNWHSLFNWAILVAVLTSFGSIIAVLLVTMVGMDPVRTQSIIMGVLEVPQLVIDVVYLLYLKKTILLFKSECEV